MSERVERDGLHTVPVDRIASRVTKPAPQWHELEERVRSHGTFGRVAPPTVAIPRDLGDLTGQRRDRVVIVGYLGGGKWLGRCDCGNFVSRNGNNWRRKPKGRHRPRHLCDDCLRGKQLRRLGGSRGPRFGGGDLPLELRPQRLILTAISLGAHDTRIMAEWTHMQIGLVQKLIRRLTRNGFIQMTRDGWAINDAGRRALAHPTWPTKDGNGELAEIRNWPRSRTAEHADLREKRNGRRPARAAPVSK